jgi:glycosyltransferase involved in cell wall biosynthesis
MARKLSLTAENVALRVSDDHASSRMSSRPLRGTFGQCEQPSHVGANAPPTYSTSVTRAVQSDLQIVQVTPSLARESSGPTYSVLRLNQALRERRVESCIAALDWPGTPSPLPHVRLFRVGVGPKRLGRSPDMARWLREVAEDCSSLVLHGHAMWQATGWYPSWAAKDTNAQVVISPRGTFAPGAMASGSKIKRLIWPLIQRPSCQEARCFHATAHAEAADIRALGFKQPIAVVPNGIDVPSAAAEVQPLRSVLFLGRVHPVKGIPVLLHAWAVIEREFPQWTLEVAGSDLGYYGTSGHLAEVTALARQLSLSRMRFIGEVHGPEKSRILRESSVFVLPTKGENFGVAVAEALAHSVPAIVTKGAPWAGLEEHKAGWWIDFGVDPLVHALRQALSSPPEQLAAMGARGREWMIRDFSWDVVGAKMAETYRWLHGQREKPEWIV